MQHIIRDSHESDVAKKGHRKRSWQLFRALVSRHVVEFIPRTADGASSFNLFGVKAGTHWNGPKATTATLEYDGTVATRQRESFRAYASIDESVNDFAQLLSSSPRYRDALKAGADAGTYARALGASGYATDPEYTNKLNEILGGDQLRAAFGVRTAGLQK